MLSAVSYAVNCSSRRLASPLRRTHRSWFACALLFVTWDADLRVSVCLDSIPGAVEYGRRGAASTALWEIGWRIRVAPPQPFRAGLTSVVPPALVLGGIWVA